MVEPGPATQPGQVLGASYPTSAVANPSLLRDVRATCPQQESAFRGGLWAIFEPGVGMCDPVT